MHPVISGNAGPKLSRGVTALASAAAKRREASAPPPYPPPQAGEGREGAARLSALHRGARRSGERCDSAQAALDATGRARALPAPSIALKPSTWLAGRHAGGDDARTARERSVSFRPRGPLSLRLQEHPHDGVPRVSEILDSAII